jgi:hypothetical protein
MEEFSKHDNLNDGMEKYGATSSSDILAFQSKLVKTRGRDPTGASGIIVRASVKMKIW